MSEKEIVGLYSCSILMVYLPFQHFQLVTSTPHEVLLEKLRKSEMGMCLHLHSRVGPISDTIVHVIMLLMFFNFICVNTNYVQL